MRNRCCWSAASLLALLLAPPLGAATVLERSVEINIRPDGSVTERTRLRVRLDKEADVASWSTYPVYLDDNRELESLAASITRPDGKTQKVSRRGQDTMEVAGEGELHSSARYRTVSFPDSSVGSVVSLDYEVKERPYFPAGAVRLGSFDRTEALRVSVRGAPGGWRWRIDGSLPGLQVTETDGGVTVTASGLAALEPPERAPGIAGDGAVLRYAWGDSAGWDGVGRWYDGLVAQVPRGAEPVRRKARELTAGLPGKRERLEALTDFARRQVRYVAVEVGIGGYRPHAPQQVMERLWGDCKDKAFLLIDLLREAGIAAFPALIRLDPEGRVDREFPAPQFNHAIVAVPAEGLGLGPDAPVAGGYLFLDATQEIGGIDWLQPAVQDQEALVVRDGRGILVRTPIQEAKEGYRLEVDLGLAASGEATGQASLAASGEIGASFLAMRRAANPQEVDRTLRLLFAAFLPAGTTLEDITWQSVGGGLPNVKVQAKVSVPSLGAAGPGSLPVLPMPERTGMPPLSLLDGRTVPLVAEPFSHQITWRLRLPQPGCKAEGQDVDVRNDLGAFRQTVAVKDGTLVVERASGLRRRWIDPEAFPALKEIALAESRTTKRRLRLSCAAALQGGGM